MGSLDYDKTFHEVNETLESNLLYVDFVRSAYGCMRMFNLLLSIADSLIKDNDLDPEQRLELVGLLMALMGVGP